MNPIAEARGFTGAIDKYKKMFSECFTGMNKKYIDDMYSFSTKYEGRLPMVSNFRVAIREHLGGKGYPKKQIDDFMDMYTAIYAVGFMTGAVAYSTADYASKISKDGLFNF